MGARLGHGQTVGVGAVALCFRPRYNSQSAHKNIIIPGKPSVFFVRQLVHICGMSCAGVRRKFRSECERGLRADLDAP